MKYLGIYEAVSLTESEQVLVPIDTEPVDTDTHCNYYDMSQLMRCNYTKEFPFHATMALSNTGGIAVQIIDCDVYKVWAV